jgi:hypothetical protein
MPVAAALTQFKSLQVRGEGGLDGSVRLSSVYFGILQGKGADVRISHIVMIAVLTKLQSCHNKNYDLKYKYHLNPALSSN